MDCSDFHKMISREVDGEIGLADRQFLERHLRECEDCREYRESFLETFSLHREMVEVQPPSSILPAVMTAVRGAERKDWMQGWLRIAVPSAAALIVLLGLRVGGFLTEVLAPAGIEEQTEVLELEYLEEYPPDSVGDLLITIAKGDGDE